jgi:hypothetical protein
MNGLIRYGRALEFSCTAGLLASAMSIFDGGTTHFIKPGAIEMASLIVGRAAEEQRPTRRLSQIARAARGAVAQPRFVRKFPVLR